VQLVLNVFNTPHCCLPLVMGAVNPHQIQPYVNKSVEQIYLLSSV